MKRDELPDPEANQYRGPQIGHLRSTWNICRQHPQPVMLERPAGPCQLCQYPDTWAKWLKMLRIGLS